MFTPSLREDSAPRFVLASVLRYIRPSSRHGRPAFPFPTPTLCPGPSLLPIPGRAFLPSRVDGRSFSHVSRSGIKFTSFCLSSLRARQPSSLPLPFVVSFIDLSARLDFQWPQIDSPSGQSSFTPSRTMPTLYSEENFYASFFYTAK